MRAVPDVPTQRDRRRMRRFGQTHPQRQRLAILRPGTIRNRSHGFQRVSR